MTDDLLAAEARYADLRASVVAVLRQLHPLDLADLRRGDSPSHHHGTPGVWGLDNPPAKAGKPCGACAAWQALYLRVKGDL